MLNSVVLDTIVALSVGAPTFPGVARPEGGPRRPPRGTLPPVPALLLAGERDLSTPMAWPRAQLARTPRGRLLVAHDAGHSVQSRASDPRVPRVVIRFLRAREMSQRAGWRLGAQICRGSRW